MERKVRRIISQIAQSIEPILLIYAFLMLIANCVLVIVLPDRVDKILSGFFLGLNILLILFWIKFFYDQSNRKP